MWTSMQLYHVQNLKLQQDKENLKFYAPNVESSSYCLHIFTIDSPTIKIWSCCWRSLEGPSIFSSPSVAGLTSSLSSLDLGWLGLPFFFIDFWSYSVHLWTKLKLILIRVKASFIYPLTLTILMTEYTTPIAKGWQPLIFKKYRTFFHIFNMNHFSPYMRFCGVNIDLNLKKRTLSKAIIWSINQKWTPISFAIQVPIALFILLIGMLKTWI